MKTRKAVRADTDVPLQLETSVTGICAVWTAAGSDAYPDDLYLYVRSDKRHGILNPLIRHEGGTETYLPFRPADDV